MKFQGRAGAKKGAENGPLAAASAAAFWPSSDASFVAGFVTGNRAYRRGAVAAKAKRKRQGRVR
jgi:hypothetical protein